MLKLKTRKCSIITTKRVGEVKRGCPGSYVGKGRMAKETKINENRRRIWICVARPLWAFCFGLGFFLVFAFQLPLPWLKVTELP